MEESACRVAIVDDDPVAQCALRLLVEHDGRHRVVGTYSNGVAALRSIASDPPEVVLLDQKMRGEGGLRCLRQIQQRRLRIAVIMVTTSSEPALVRDCLQAGARGYLLKPPSLEHVTLAITAALLGGVYLNVEPLRGIELSARQQSGQAQRPLPGAKRLSSRERQILQYLANGRKNESIASELNLRPCTVDTYVRRLFIKLAVHSRTEAVSAARIAGVDPLAWSNARNRRQD
jgi:DNA-binding NarL/FixJ family response regulator